MIKKIIAFALAALPITSIAQVTLNAQLPAAGFVQKEQLWNLILVNNNADILDLTIQLNLQDVVSGQTVLTASTGNMLVGKGVKLVKGGDIQPIVYNYIAPDLSGNYLPMGAYIACYQLMSKTSQKETAIAEECIRVNIDPLSPPMLSSPPDKAELTSPYPQFSWMPPAPFDMFSNLSYDLLVTEILEGQSATEAIQYNNPIYSKSNISQPYESYASSFTKLDTGKVYAWQVLAKNGLSYAAKTEVWTFKVGGLTWIQKIIDETPYVKMKRDNAERGIAPNGVLKFSYYNETSDTMAIVRLSIPNDDNKLDMHFEIKIVPGENLVQKDIQKLLNAKNGMLYEAYIISGRNEKWQVFFEIKTYKDKSQ